MPQNAIYLSSLPNDDFPRKRWTKGECRFLTEASLLRAGKFELIEGDIVLKRPQSRLHILVVTQVLMALSAIFGLDHLQIRTTMGIGIYDEDESDAEPDVAVLREPLDRYLVHHPRPNTDVSLVVEVSDSTLRGDLTAKARVYARAGVPDYWVLDTERQRFIVQGVPK